MVQTGDDGSGTQSFMDKIEGSNSYAALLWATMGVSVFMMIFYAIQITKDGSIIVPNARAIREVLTAPNTKKDDLEPRARSLMSLKDSSESFLLGMGRVFPALIILTLAWASGSIMKAVGCDRLFAAWIVGSIPPETLPTLSFVISLFMAIAVCELNSCCFELESLGNHGGSLDLSIVHYCYYVYRLEHRGEP